MCWQAMAFVVEILVARRSLSNRILKHSGWPPFISYNQPFFGIIWYWHLHNSPTKYIFPLILKKNYIANWFNYSIFLLTHLMMNINFWVPWWPCFITMLFPWYENSIVTYSLSILQLQFNKQYITKIAVNKNLPN